MGRKVKNNETALSANDDSTQALSIVGGVPTDMLRQALVQQTEQRKLIKQFIQDHLEDGVDYGTIHVVGSTKCANPYTCKLQYHFSKPVLFKPGQEKLFSLFQITSELSRDDETYLMLPERKNLVAYKCIMKRGDKTIGEGRGAAEVGDKGRDVNATIKIAQKRARMDACLSLGFSEYFAQDLDDPDYKTQAEMANQRVAEKAADIDRDEFGLYPADPKARVSDDEKRALMKEFLKVGMTNDRDIVDIISANGINSDMMTSGDARRLMRMVRDNAQKTDTIEADSSLISEKSARAIEPAELVVDDELRTRTQELYLQIGFNRNGDMWFMKQVNGRPFAKWEQFTDRDWSRAFQFVMDILDTKIDVEDRYMHQVEVDDKNADHEEQS